PPPKWKPAPPELTSRFEAELANIPGAERKKMFGYSAGFVGGNMFAGIFQDSVVLRLSDANRAVFVERIGGTPFEPMPGRVMREYVVAPKSVVDDDAAFREWLLNASAFTATKPPKVKAEKKPKAPARKTAIRRA